MFDSWPSWHFKSWEAWKSCSRMCERKSHKRWNIAWKLEGVKCVKQDVIDFHRCTAYLQGFMTDEAAQPLHPFVHTLTPCDSRVAHTDEAQHVQSWSGVTPTVPLVDLLQQSQQLRHVSLGVFEDAPRSRLWSPVQHAQHQIRRNTTAPQRNATSNIRNITSFKCCWREACGNNSHEMISLSWSQKHTAQWTDHTHY